MVDEATTMHDAPPVVEGTPSQVRDRLSRRILVMRSLWFPTPRELRAWKDAGVPAYVVWLPDDGFEVGPRTESMWAACFSPVLRGRLEDEVGRTRLAWKRSWPRFTMSVLAMWAVTLTAWLVAIGVQLASGTVDLGAILWWTVLAVSTSLGPGLGATLGGRALDDAAEWVRTTASAAVEEDW